MLEKHKEDWAEKVRIVGLSVDQKKDEVIKRVNEKNFTLVDHFFLGGWNDSHNAIKNYQFDGVPHVVLFDNKGKVIHAGHPSHIDIEKTINGIVTGVNEEVPKEEKKHFNVFSKTLSKKVVELLNSEYLKSPNYKLTIEWQKENTYNEKGEVLKFSFKKPKLNLTYHIKHEAEAKKVEETLYKLLDKSFFEVTVSIDNPKAVYQYSVNILKNELAANNLQEVELQFNKTHALAWTGTNFRIMDGRSFNHKDVLKPQKLDEVTAFQKGVRKALEGNDDPKKGILLNRLGLQCHVTKGDEFVPLEVQDVFKEAEAEDAKVTLKHEENEVLLVDFWETGCGPCQEPMAHNQEMLEKNAEKWGNKVRIVAVSLDDSIEDVKKRVEEQKWKKIVHYFLGENQKGSQIYGIRAIPLVVLVDQKGVVVFNGNPTKTNLEENINDLLEGKTLEESKKEEEKKEEESVLQPVTKEECKKLTTLIKDPKFAEEVKTILTGMKYNPRFLIQLVKSKHLDKEFNVKQVTFENPELNYAIRKVDLNKFNQVLSKIYEVFPANKFKETKEIFETVNFSWGIECDACKKALKPFDPQYYCSFCKLWFCSECGEKEDSTKNGNDRLVHPHNMVWINITNEEGLQDIDEYKLGKNVMFTENKQQFPASCNGCDGPVGNGYRYICLSCRPGPKRPGGFVDLCHKCLGTLKNKEENEEVKSQKEKVLKGLENEHHDPNSHLWLRICYGGDYYVF